MKGTGTGRASEKAEKLSAELAIAKARITAVESQLASKQEELAELQEMIWDHHHWLPGGCECHVCLAVERSRKELQGLI